MQEFHTDVEALAIFALPGPYDLGVHFKRLLSSFEVDADPDDVADGEILLGADPGPGHGKVVSIGIDPTVCSGFRSLAPVLYKNVVPFPKPLVLPVFHFTVLREPS